MDINDYFRFYREDTRTFDYDYKIIQENIKKQKELEEIKKHLESIRLKNLQKKKMTKLEKERNDFFFSIQSLMNGEAKSLVASPPNNDSKEHYINYINKYKDWMELTITFIPLYRSVFTDYQIHNILYSEISKYIKGCEVILIPEYNKNNHLHYHGFIRGQPSKINKIKTMLSTCFGRTELKAISFYNSYIEYTFKDWKLPLSDLSIKYKKFIISLIYDLK